MSASSADPEPSGAYRLSDQERNEAMSALGDAYAQGRLDHEEFESRLADANRATFAADLDALFADLPRHGPKVPAVQSALPSEQGATAGHRRARRGPSHVPGGSVRTGGPPLLVPVAALVAIALATHVWFLLIVAFFVASAGRRRRWAAVGPNPGILGRHAQWTVCGSGRR